METPPDILNEVCYSNYDKQKIYILIMLIDLMHLMQCAQQCNVPTEQERGLKYESKLLAMCLFLLKVGQLLKKLLNKSKALCSGRRGCRVLGGGHSPPY